MALIQFKTGKRKQLPTATAVQIWRCMVGLDKPDPKQVSFCAAVKSVSLNWRDAPDEYIAENLHHIIPLALAEWRVDRAGNPIRPVTAHAWAFAKRWGLWVNGKPAPEIMKPSYQPAQLQILALT